MSARNLGRFGGLASRGPGVVAIHAVVLGGLLGGLSACSGGSDETSSATGTSGAATVAPTASITSPPASGSASSAPSASASVSASAGSPPATSSAQPAPDAVLKISVQGRTVSPPPGRRTVSVGDRVLLVVTTDTPNTLHVHGVEVEKEMKPGVPLKVEFTVKDPGVYAVELHAPELLLVQLVVR